MMVTASCKFCKKPIELHLDDDFVRLREDERVIGIERLLSMGCCNRCSDFREKRRRIVEVLRDMVMQVAMERRPAVQRMICEEMREGLKMALTAYMNLAVEWHGGSALDWDDSMLDAVVLGAAKTNVKGESMAMKHLHDVLEKIWQMSRHKEELL